MQDVLLDSFRTFTKCDQSAEEIALKRLALVAAGSRAKIGRAEVEFALGLVNQTNKLFSKGASDIRKHCDAQGPGGPEREAIQRTVRVVIAAFKFLHANRGIAGFSALALEKTMSNFLTACTNAHVGLWAWEGLVFLRKLLLEHANSHIVAPAGTNGRPRQKGSSDTARGSHVEQQEKQLSGTAATLVSTRPVRKPASRLKKEMSPSNHGGTSDSSSLVGAEGIAIGMRRLSMNKQASSEESKVSEIHFPLKHCQSDLAFNTLVITLLCNMLRALSLSPKSQLAQKHIRSLAQRQNSVLDWCLRVREMDRDSMDPFLGVCFRAYYALGSGSGGQHLAIRLLGILAYANTSKRDFRELLKYAARGAALALGSASSTISNVDCVLLHKQVAQYYASIFEHVSPLLTSASVSPELVEFCHSMAQSRQNSGDLKGSIVAVQYIAMCGQQEDERKDSCASLIARILVWDILVRDALLRGLMDTEIESVVGGFVELVEHAIDGDLRHTLAVWNSLALCADIIRRVARNVYTELRQGKTEDLQLQASKATVLALGVATRIYDVYIARGAASKAESAGGTSIAVLLSHSAESSLVLIQLALQFLEHDRDVQAEIEKHSDRLLKVCEDEKCNSDYLRNHSTVFFNRGASLYQLKIYSQAAQAIERAIDSLSQWFVLSMAKKQPTGDVFGQICKRYEVAASAYQANGDFDRAATTYARAVSLIVSHFPDQIRSVITTADQKKNAISKRRSVNPEMLVLFSKASFTYSVMALKRGDLADSVNFGLHSYRILYSLLKSLLLSHKRSLSKSTRRFQDSNRIEPEDDPFSDSKSDKPNEDETLDDQEKSDAEFLAFSSNWELQRLLIDSLAHLSEIYSVRGSVKEAEYFLNKGLEITSQLNAPFQESFMRLREADILSRKGLWDECATSLSKLYKTATDDFPSGLITAVDALVTEGDAWRRCGMPSQAQAAYLRAKKIVTCISEDELDRDTRAIPVRIDEDTPRIERIISRLGRFEISNDSSNDLANRAGREIPDLVAALQEDIGIRQKLLSVLDGLSKDAVSKGDLKYKVVGVSSDRAVDQRSEYLLMQANILFLELQSILEADDSFNMVFKSAFVFPALQRSRAQKPRKGTLKANIKTKLAMLDTLLTSALETVVSVGSAHCVHSLSHLLVLVKAVASAFGFDSAQEDSNMLHHTLSRIIDGAKNITVVREAVDALQRKDEPISAQINSWPSETIGGKKENEISSSRTNAIDSRDTLSCSPVRFGIDSNKPSSMDQLPLSFGMLGDETSSVSPFADYDVLKRAADGKRATSDWMSNNSNAAEDDTSLERLLPSSWVVCGISIHHSSNMLLITRYEREREPITACLPMREINVDLENIALLETEDTATASVFDSVNKNIAAIIDASDKSMRVGKDCSTEAEKRTWWEQRTALDRQLGTILRNIQSEWLGGFHSLLNPADIFGAAVDTDNSEKTVALLREDIQTCIHGLLPKSFATKAKAIELTSQLCNLVLHVAMLDEDGKETDRERGNGGGDSGGEWLDVCAMLWDVYSYQGAAPQCTDDDLSKLATELKQVLDNHIRTHGLQSMPTRKAEAKQRHLILTLDKYAQQIPWESLPCLRDCPVSRMPSVAFIKHRLVAMNKGFNSQHSKLSDTLSGKGLYDTGLFSDLDIRKPLFSDSLVQPDMHQSTDISSTPSTSALPFGKDGRDISDIDNSMDGDSPGVRVDGSRVFYVLNPEGDLHRTQENFEGFVCGQQGWRGIVGRRPMNHECEYGLSANDIFVYFGHGGAEAYIQRTQVRGLRRCAVALLLGCSSGRLKPAGEYDALGTAMDYMIGGCPALVGNLWDVGDKDIDRFAASMLRKWGLARFSDGTIEVGYEPACDANGKQKDGNGGISDDSNALSLTEAVCNARKACRMPFLTGAAPVVYGLPVYLS
ncbi:separin protein [Coemansia sp. RSA 2049]|nr:separin protein [Coemansia sp. RSA 2049]